MKKLIAVFALMLSWGLHAQTTAASSASGSEVFESYKLQQKRNLNYYIPENYSPDKKYPLIIVLDAEYLFDNVVANTKFRSRFQGMPECIVVGVNQFAKEQRYYDCGFEKDTGLPTEDGKKFFEFLGMELIPYLEGKYSTAPFKMFVGYDITANFGNFYLFKDKSIFNAYITISPTLAPDMETRVPARLGALDQKIFYQLILEGTPSNDRPKILAMDKAIKLIDKDNLYYNFDEYPMADHTTVATYGIGRALDNIFAIFKPISATEYKTEILTSDNSPFQYLENKYSTIEELFGFKKPMELNDVMAIYAASKKKEDYESLKELSDLCKKEYPDTMMGFYFEGECYEHEGEAKKALRTYEKAFGMAEIDFLTKEMALGKIDTIKADFGF